MRVQSIAVLSRARSGQAKSGREPTVRHGADLSYIPVVPVDACGSGNEDAAQRTIENFKFMGDAFVTDTDTVCQLLDNRRRGRTL
jgi:nicotinamidase-related amidase